MTPIEQTLVTIPMATALGLMFGMGACTLACLPYLGPVFLAGDGGIRRSWRILLPFSLGRLASYAALATAAGQAGQYLGNGFDGGHVRSLLGIAAVMVGVALLLRPRLSAAGCHQSREVQVTHIDRPRASRTLMPGGLFFMGAGMALTPCAPFGTVLFSAATASDARHGLLLGLGFGVGAIVIPSFIYGVGFAYLGSRLRERLHDGRHHIERLGAALLILTGAGNLLS